MTSKTITVFCYGNPAREDDGLGPELARRLEELSLPNVAVESNYQLVVEDAAEISESSMVVFVDATIEGEEPFAFWQLEERPDSGYMDHTIGPEHLLGLTRQTFGQCPPAFALGIRGYSFDMFKEGLTPRAEANLTRALGHLADFLRTNEAEIYTPQSSIAGAGECASGGLK